jgi:glycosyltransferase involved in cell wall biosynthesis
MNTLAVIIPTADRPELLLRAVESVRRQTFPPNKIVVVDNGVLDCGLIVPDDQVVILRAAPRIGPGRSRNLGAQHAGTDYIAFLDDDDVWDADYLRHSMSLVVQFSALVVVGRLKRRAANGASDKDYKLFPSHLNDQRSVYYKNPGFGGQNIFLRNDLFLRLGGFDEKMPASEDRDLAARILQAGETIYVQEQSVAILCDHEGERVRSSQVRGNRMFLVKHWRHMRFFEIYQAFITYLKRLVMHKLS